MNDIPHMHAQAMHHARLADEALARNDNEAFLKETEEAFLLEKEAAMKLATHKDAEPSRGVLFRSAALLAFDLKNYKAAEQLIDEGLSGNPYEEIRKELVALLLQIRANQPKGMYWHDLAGARMQEKTEIEWPARYSLAFNPRLVNDTGNKTILADATNKMQLVVSENLNAMFSQVRQYRQLVVHIFRRFMDTDWQVEDVLQEALIKTYVRITNDNDLMQPAYLRAYFERTVRNICLNLTKQKSLHKRDLKGYAVSVDTVTYQQDYLHEHFQMEDEVKKAIAELGIEEREVIKLWMNGGSERGVSLEMGLPMYKVRALKLEAFKKMREKLSFSYYSI